MNGRSGMKPRAFRRFGLGLEIVAVDEDAARRRLQQPGNHPHRRRLAGAVGPEEAVNFARLDVEDTPSTALNVPYSFTRS